MIADKIYRVWLLYGELVSKFLFEIKYSTKSHLRKYTMEDHKDLSFLSRWNFKNKLKKCILSIIMFEDDDHVAA